MGVKGVHTEDGEGVGELEEEGGGGEEEESCILSYYAVSSPTCDLDLN